MLNRLLVRLNIGDSVARIVVRDLVLGIVLSALLTVALVPAISSNYSYALNLDFRSLWEADYWQSWTNIFVASLSIAVSAAAYRLTYIIAIEQEKVLTRLDVRAVESGFIIAQTKQTIEEQGRNNVRIGRTMRLLRVPNRTGGEGSDEPLLLCLRREERLPYEVDSNPVDDADFTPVSEDYTLGVLVAALKLTGNGVETIGYGREKVPDLKVVGQDRWRVLVTFNARIVTEGLGFPRASLPAWFNEDFTGIETVQATPYRQWRTTREGQKKENHYYAILARLTNRNGRPIVVIAGTSTRGIFIVGRFLEQILIDLDEQDPDGRSSRYPMMLAEGDFVAVLEGSFSDGNHVYETKIAHFFNVEGNPLRFVDAPAVERTGGNQDQRSN